MRAACRIYEGALGPDSTPRAPRNLARRPEPSNARNEPGERLKALEVAVAFCNGLRLEEESWSIFCDIGVSLGPRYGCLSASHRFRSAPSLMKARATLARAGRSWSRSHDPGPEGGPRRGGPALEAIYGLIPWLIPTLGAPSAPAEVPAWGPHPDHRGGEPGELGRGDGHAAPGAAAHLFFHRAAMLRRAQAQALLHIVIEIANCDARHDRPVSGRGSADTTARLQCEQGARAAPMPRWRGRVPRARAPSHEESAPQDGSSRHATGQNPGKERGGRITAREGDRRRFSRSRFAAAQV